MDGKLSEPRLRGLRGLSEPRLSGLIRMSEPRLSGLIRLIRKKMKRINSGFNIRIDCNK